MNNETKLDWRELINSSLPAQREAITSEASLTVVSAGAGTGKTETLAKRVAWLLSSDPECPVDGLLVLTFTEKAAQEMRGRIEGMLKDWYAAYPKELAHLKERIAKIEDAQISTIHSFAMKVIRESGLALDLAPDASIIPEPDERLWWETFAEALDTLDTAGLRAVLDGVWKDRAEELFNSDELRRLITAKGQQGPQTLADAAKETASKLGSCGQTPEELWEHDDAALLKDVESCYSVFEEIWVTWHDTVFPSMPETFSSKPDARLEKLRDLKIEFSQAENTDDNMRVFAARLINEGLRGLPSRSKQKDDLENALGKKLTEWRDEKQPLLFLASRPSDAETRYAGLLNRICALGWHCWDELRRSRGMMSQDDLISYAVDVLKKTPDYGQKFRHIFVDEFQDTDDMQDKLLGLLKNSGNTLFIVGDLKQSIYRFRHAKPENFQRYISQAQNCRDGSCRYVSLSCSFRTRNQLLEKFDEIFKDIWRGGYIEQGKNMRYESISGPDTDGSEWWKIRCQEASDHVVETLMAETANGLPKGAAGVTSSGKESSYYALYRLFSELAARFSALRSGGLKVWDKKAFGDVLKERRDRVKKGEKLPDWEQEADKIFRPARWKDFAVLVPTKSFYQPLERAFGRAGVPYVLCTSKDYYSRSEVLDAVNLLRLLAEPDDALCMTGWLESPFSGVASQKVSAYIKEACERRSPLNLQMPIAAVLAEKDPQAIERLTELRKTADLCGAAAVVAEISKSQEYLSFFEPDKRCRVTANLTHLALLAEEYESSQGRSLIGCADYLSGAASDDKAQEEPDVADENEDAVNILTIHASKGLEYPVVALAGTEKGVRAPSGVCVSERYGVVDKTIPDFMLGEEEPSDTVRFAWFKKLETDALTAEKQRLWYVAATRAGEKLFVCGLVGAGKNGVNAVPKDGTFLSHIVKLKEGDDEFCGLTRLKRADWTEFDAQSRHAEEEQTEKAVLSVVSPASLGRLSASAYAMLCWCPTAFRIAFRQGRNLEWAVKGGEGSGGSEFGSLAHWVLARWNFRAEQLGLWLPEEGESAVHLPFELKEEFANGKKRAEIRRLLADFAASDAGKELAVLAADGELLKRETPFRVQDGDLLLVGATDLMWTQDGCLHIRDWKTTSEEAAPREYYGAQIDFYAYAAWLYCGCKTTVDASLVYLRDLSLNKKTNIYSENLFCRIKQSVHDAATIALSGAFERRTDRCASCPWIKDCMQ